MCDGAHYEERDGEFCGGGGGRRGGGYSARDSMNLCKLLHE